MASDYLCGHAGQPPCKANGAQTDAWGRTLGAGDIVGGVIRSGYTRVGGYNLCAQSATAEPKMLNGTTLICTDPTAAVLSCAGVYWSANCNCPSGLGGSPADANGRCTGDPAATACTNSGGSWNTATSTCSCPAGLISILGVCQADPHADCANSGGIWNSTTNTCSCPVGQVSIGNVCHIDLGANCTNSGGTWNAFTSTCSCPAGQISVGGACQNDPAATACGNTGGTWDTATSTCSCPAGQISIGGACQNDPGFGCISTGGTWDTTTSTCSCPAGQISVGGACQNDPGAACTNSGGSWDSGTSTCSCPAGIPLNPSTGACDPNYDPCAGPTPNPDPMVCPPAPTSTWCTPPTYATDPTTGQPIIDPLTGQPVVAAPGSLLDGNDNKSIYPMPGNEDQGGACPSTGAVTSLPVAQGDAPDPSSVIFNGTADQNGVISFAFKPKPDSESRFMLQPNSTGGSAGKFSLSISPCPGVVNPNGGCYVGPGETVSIGIATGSGVNTNQYCSLQPGKTYYIVATARECPSGCSFQAGATNSREAFEPPSAPATSGHATAGVLLSYPSLDTPSDGERAFSEDFQCQPSTDPSREGDSMVYTEVAPPTAEVCTSSPGSPVECPPKPDPDPNCQCKI